MGLEGASPAPRPVGPLPVELPVEEGEEAKLALQARVLPSEVGGKPTGAEDEAEPDAVVSYGAEARTPGGKRVTLAQWEALLTAYRKIPRGHKHAARAAGLGVETAEKAWHHGFRYAEWGKVPVKKILEVEQRDARAIVQERYAHDAANRLHAELERERQAAEQAAEARADEGMNLQLGRKATKQMLATQVALIPGLRMLAERVNESLMVLMGEGQRLTLAQIKEALGLVEKSAVTIRHLSAATETLIEAERMHMGEPGKRVGVVVMSKDDALEEIRRAQRALADFTGVDTDADGTQTIDLSHHRFLKDSD